MVSNCNGKDDDNLPSTQGICSQGGVKNGGFSEQGVPSSSSNIDELIYGLEWDAYYALLKAFTAQSELLTWAKEGLMSNLRKELRIANEQHRQMLETIRDDETLTKVLTWRHMRKDPSIPLPPPTFYSQKKQKVSHVGPLSPLLKPPLHRSIVTSTSKGQRVPMQKTYSNKGNANAIKFNVVSKGAPRPKVGRGEKRLGGPIPCGHLKSVSPSIKESWVGRSLLIRWSEDNIFYQALIVGYDKEVNLHRVAYDSGTLDETFEWIDLTKMGENDIQWLDNVMDPILPHGNKGCALDFSTKQRKTRGFRLSMEKSKGRNEGRRPFDKSLQAPSTLQSRLERREALIEVDNNRALIKYPEVVRLVKEIDALEHEKDLEKLEDGKQMVKEYEEMLQKALVMVTNFSIDGESKEDGDSSDNNDSSTNDDSSMDDDSSGLEVNYSHAPSAWLDCIEDNGDNDDYIEID